MIPEPLTNVLEYAVSHPEQIATLLTGIAGGAVHYAKTGRVPTGLGPSTPTALTP